MNITFVAPDIRIVRLALWSVFTTTAFKKERDKEIKQKINEYRKYTNTNKSR